MTGKERSYFTALYEVTKMVSASLSPARVMQEIVSCVAATMKVKACSLRLLDSRRKRLLMGACFGLSEGYIRKGPVVVEESGLDKKALKGKSVFLKNAQKDKNFQYRDKARSEGIRSVLVVPLMMEKKAIGVLRVYTDKEKTFKEDELQFLEMAANLSAIALENARLHQALRNDYDLLVAHKYRLDDN